MRMTEEQYKIYLERTTSRAPEKKNNPRDSVAKVVEKAEVSAVATENSLLSAAYEYLALGQIKAPQSPLLITLRQGIKELTGGGRISYERTEQAIALLWLEINNPAAFAVATANPMGGFRPNGAGGQMKGEGAKAGYPDLLVDFPVKPYHGLRIEMKRNKLSAKPSEEQVSWLSNLGQHGYCAALCRGHLAAIELMQFYFSSRPIGQHFLESKLIEMY